MLAVVLQERDCARQCAIVVNDKLQVGGAFITTIEVHPPNTQRMLSVVTFQLCQRRSGVALARHFLVDYKGHIAGKQLMRSRGLLDAAR